MFNPDCLVPIESRGILVNTLASTVSDWSNAARLFSYNAAAMNMFACQLVSFVFVFFFASFWNPLAKSQFHGFKPVSNVVLLPW